MFANFLDEAQEFYDYGTSTATQDDIIDKIWKF